MKQSALSLLVRGILALSRLAAVCFALSALGANVVRNPGFDSSGTNGISVTLSGPPKGAESAAADWSQGLIPGGTFLTTELQPSDDPLPGGGGQMLHFFTDSVGFGSSGCVVGQDLSPVLLPLYSTGFVDVRVVSGVAHIGFVDSANGGTFYDSGGVWITGPAAWQRVVFTNLDFPTGLIEIQLYAPAQQLADVFLDNASAVARMPEYVAEWFTIDGGGGTSAAAGAFQVSGTIGQPDAGVVRGGGYALAGGFWGAGIGRAGPPPFLRILRMGNQMRVVWPASSANYHLQQNSTLSAVGWSDVTTQASDDGIERTVTLLKASQAMFYRLISP
jgi:hypothetical protein